MRQFSKIEKAQIIARFERELKKRVWYKKILLWMLVFHVGVREYVIEQILNSN